MEESGIPAWNNHIVITGDGVFSISALELMHQEIAGFMDLGHDFLDHAYLLRTIFGIVGKQGEVSPRFK